MESIAYFALGTIDILVLLALLFKIFRWPYFSYIRECLMIAIVCSLESYLSRMVFHFPEWDMVAQNLIIILMMKSLMKVNFYRALSTSIIGSLAYSEVVYSVYNILTYLGFIAEGDQATTIGVFTMQIISQAVGFTIACCLYVFNLGFSFIPVPPHDSKRRFSKNEKINLILNSLAVIIIFGTMFLFITYGSFGVNIVMFAELIALLGLLYLARKQDYGL